jgi:predicted ArsR family transcriptional regulator
MALGLTVNKSVSLISKQMPLTRRRILTLLKEQSELTADELADILGISAVAVRRHLTKLESDQLVVYQEVQRGMGRPSFVYRLGEGATNFFPHRYEELASTVLETIKQLYGFEAVDAIFRVRSEQLISDYQRKVNGRTLDTRLEQLTQLREADGYMSAWESGQNGAFILREANCPIIHVAEGCGSACAYDQTMLETVLNAEVVRIGHLVQGDGACTYEVREKNHAKQ